MTVPPRRPGPPPLPDLGLGALAEALTAQPSVRIAGEGFARAAVALVVNPDLDLLFIRRSERDGDPWSGHMALPGGRLDPADAGPQAAAERETWEEVGLPLSNARLLGPLDEVASPVRRGHGRLVISPFVYALPSHPRLVTNHEVAQTYWFGLSRILTGEGRGTFDLRWQGRVIPMPVLRLDDAEIWGLTLGILDDLVRRLGLPPVSGR